MEDTFLPRGYNPPKAVMAIIAPYKSPDPVLIDGLLYHASLLSLCFIAALLLAFSRWLELAVLYPVILVLSGRQQRAIELIVHDCSHYNFVRKRRRLNDVSTNLLFAMPVAQLVGAYRKQHIVHHKEFGGERDPCRRRMEELAAQDPAGAKANRISIRSTLTYAASYYRTVALSGISFAAFVGWHAVVGAGLGALIAAFFPIPLATWLIAYVGTIIVPFFLSLPILRMVAEREEHDYFNGHTEFSATITNIGFWHKTLVHPWDDAYHLLHHMYPFVPQTKHKKFHGILDDLDKHYRSSWRRDDPLGEYYREVSPEEPTAKL